MPTNSNDPALLTPILPAEYDFHSVPREELQGCVYYEYARESKEVTGAVEEYAHQFSVEVKRQGAKKGTKVSMSIQTEKLTELPGFLEQALIAQIASAVRSIRDVPWQSLSDSKRKQLTGIADNANRMQNDWQLRHFPPVRMDSFLEDSSLGEMTLNAWREKSTPERLKKAPTAAVEKSLISGFFRLDTRYTRTVLIKQFGDWLRAKQLSREHKPAKGRHSDRDALNQLGALRLRYFYPWSEAQALVSSLTQVPNAICYGDHRAWNRACDNAVERFRSLFMLPANTRPIHFTRGWRK